VGFHAAVVVAGADGAEFELEAACCIFGLLLAGVLLRCAISGGGLLLVAVAVELGDGNVGFGGWGRWRGGRRRCIATARVGAHCGWSRGSSVEVKVVVRRGQKSSRASNTAILGGSSIEPDAQACDECLLSDLSVSLTKLRTSRGGLSDCDMETALGAATIPTEHSLRP